MKIVLILLFFCILDLSPVDEHDAVIAVFNLKQTTDKLHLNIGFDIEDYTLIHNIPKRNVTQDHLSEYLNTKSVWFLNDNPVHIEVASIEMEGEHFQADCYIEFSESKITRVAVKNEFMLEVEGHSNIIMLDLNDTYRDFRMHSDRKSITIDY